MGNGQPWHADAACTWPGTGSAVTGSLRSNTKQYIVSSGRETPRAYIYLFLHSELCAGDNRIALEEFWST